MPGKPSAGRPLCRGTTAANKPCRQRAAAGSAYCAQHGGARRKTGRPTKLDEGTALLILEAITIGATLEVAAQSAGINVATLYNWRDRGEDDLEHGRDSVFARFVEDFTRAQAEGEVTLIRVIRSQGPADWRAAAWLLERRHRERWARTPADTIDPEVAERALPRDVVPDETKRDTILGILAAATAPPTGAPDTNQ